MPRPIPTRVQAAVLLAIGAATSPSLAITQTGRPAATTPAAPRPASRPAVDFAQTFRQLDLNGDQAVSRGEVPQEARQAFETLLKHGDSDEDGTLSGEEIRGLGQRLREAGPSLATGATEAAGRFRRADRDGDGRISRDEFPGRPAMFDRLDRDGDGFLGPREALGAPRAVPPPPTPAPPGRPERADGGARPGPDNLRPGLPGTR